MGRFRKKFSFTQSKVEYGSTMSYLMNLERVAIVEEDLASKSSEEAQKTENESKRVLETCYQPLKEAVYDNHKLVAPDGRLLCRCGMKKVNWYVSRGLATITSEDEEGSKTVQLKFEPAGSGEHGDAYQLAYKNNHCVVCGRDDYNTKHHIVEYEYRQHMPVRPILAF